MTTQKRLGILTSGGDCPGLNAVIRAGVSHATLSYDWLVFGIPYATQGLLERQIIPLHMHSFDLRGIDPLLTALRHRRRCRCDFDSRNLLFHSDDL